MRSRHTAPRDPRDDFRIVVPDQHSSRSENNPRNQNDRYRHHHALLR